MDFEQHVGFLEKFRDQFERIVMSLPGKARRVVVFVDDLDRCSPDKALQMLDAIKVFLDIPECIFVLGLDFNVVQQALMLKFPDDRLAQREYLAKIIQLPFELPPLTDADLADYLRGLDVQFPDERCRAVLLSSLARNPREIKRVINVYSLYWYLSLAAGAALAPVRLAKVIVIQQAFAQLFILLREQPGWLALIERAMRAHTGKPVFDEPPDMSSATMATNSAGISIPPALEPFLSEPVLQRLLTMNEINVPESDDASFAFLSAEEIGVYFTLTRRMVQPQHSAARPVAAESSDVITSASADEPLVEFGHYRVLERLATTGISELFVAEDQQTGRRVVLKRLISTLANNAEWRARFDRETGIQSRLHHPNIANLLDTGNITAPDGQTIQFSIMELITGKTLAEMLRLAGRLSAAEARTVLVPIFDALAYIHDQGIVHLDIKPSNILVTTTGQPKLTDFGLAGGVGEMQGNHVTEDTRTRPILGSPQYMSVDQLEDAPLGPPSDLYSLGIVIYECLVGRRPFEGSAGVIFARKLKGEMIPPSEANHLLPVAMDHCILRLLAPAISDRYPDAKIAKTEFVAALDHVPEQLLAAT